MTGRLYRGEERRRKLFYAALITGYFAAWFAWGAFHSEEPHPIHFYIPPMFGLTILLHELGHLGAARLVDFRFREIMLFGVFLRRKDSKWEWEVDEFRYGGHAGSDAVGIHNLPRRLAFIVAAGPMVNILSIVAAILLFRVWPESPALIVWIILSLIALTWSLRNDWENDLRHFRWALGEDKEAKQYLGAYVVRADVDEEARRQRLDELGLPNAIRMTRIHDLVAREDLEGARKEIEAALAAESEGHVEDQVWFECTAAFLFAHRGVDVEKAERLLPPEERARAYERLAPWLYAAAMIAAQRGRWEDVIQYVRRARKSRRIGRDTYRWLEMARRSAERHLEHAEKLKARRTGRG